MEGERESVKQGLERDVNIGSGGGERGRTAWEGAEALTDNSYGRPVTSNVLAQ